MNGFYRMPVSDVMRLRKNDVDGYLTFKSAASFYASTVTSETLRSTFTVCIVCSPEDGVDDFINVIDVCARDRMCTLIIFDVSSSSKATNEERLSRITESIANDPMTSDWVDLNSKSGSFIAFYRT